VRRAALATHRSGADNNNGHHHHHQKIQQNGAGCATMPTEETSVRQASDERPSERAMMAHYCMIAL